MTSFVAFEPGAFQPDAFQMYSDNTEYCDADEIMVISKRLTVFAVTYNDALFATVGEDSDGD